MLHESRPYQRHSATSKAAAEGVVNAGTQRARLMDFLSEGPATDEEMQEGAGIAGNAQRPRRGELVSMGLVRDSGRTKRNKSGSGAVLWEIVPVNERDPVRAQGSLF